MTDELGPTTPEREDDLGTFEDFDDFDDAAEEKPYRFKANGKMYEGPVDVSAKLVLKIMREGVTATQKAVEDNPAEADEILRQVFGAALYERLLDDGVGVEKMSRIAGRLVQKAVAKMRGDSSNGGAGSGGKDPQSASSTSSGTGRRSRQTSAASTK